MADKHKKDAIITCSQNTCLIGNDCPNFSIRPDKRTFSFPDCMYGPIYKHNSILKRNNNNNADKNT